MEYQLRLDPRSADSDEDGVPDGEEDTDGDGFGNLAEVAAGTLPGQAASHPETSPPGGTGGDGDGDGSGSSSGSGNEQGTGNGTTGSSGSVVPPVGGTALAATTDMHLSVRSVKVSGGVITRHSPNEWIYTSGLGTPSEEMAALKEDGWDISDSFTMDVPTSTDAYGMPTGYETRYWWTAKKHVGDDGQTILPFSGLSGVLASEQAVSEAYADEPGQIYQGDVSGELNLNVPASGDVFTGGEEGGGVRIVSEFAASKQSTPLADTGLYPQGEAAEVWVEGFAPDVAHRRTYLILTSSTAFQAEPDWQGVGTVTFILEPGLTGIGRVEATTGAAPWVTVQNGRLWVEPPVQEGMKNVVRLLPVEVVELSPKVKDEDSNDIAGSEKPNCGKPLTPLVEVDPNANRIAHREIKVRIGDAMIDKKVTWTLEALPGGTPETIRGQWEDSPNHKDRFEASMVYGANGFRKVSKSSGVTTVGTDGHTAIRVNMPPIGFNQARIKVQIEGMSTPIVLIDMEVPGVVIIDPGHGGQDSGAVGRTDRTILEKDLALEYSFSLRQKVIDKFGAEKHNLKLYMTRKTNGEYMENGARANLARDKGADVFLSIHFNSAESTTSRGTEYVTRSIGQVNAAEDDQLGVSVQSSTLAAINASDPEGIHRDPKSGQFAVISDSNYGNTADYHPIRGVTIEVEFLSHETALGSVKLSNAKGKAIKTKFAADVSTDIYNNILNQP